MVKSGAFLTGGIDPNLLSNDELSVIRSIPIAVNNATSRKSAATYTAEEIVPLNGLKVIQNDLPDVVWTLLNDSDITLDANWAGLPRTNADGALQLSNVMLNTGNFTAAIAEYILPSNNIATKWITDGVTTVNKVFPIIVGFSIPGSLIASGNKIGLTGTFWYKKSVGGLNSQPSIGIIPNALIDDVNGSFSATYIPRLALGVGTDTEMDGKFQVIFVFVPITGSTTEFRLELDPAFTSYGRTTNWTSGSAVANTLTVATGMTYDAPGFSALYTSGQNTEISLVLWGATANVHEKTFDFSGLFGIRAFEA